MRNASVALPERSVFRIATTAALSSRNRLVAGASGSASGSAARATASSFVVAGPGGFVTRRGRLRDDQPDQQSLTHGSTRQESVLEHLNRSHSRPGRRRAEAKELA
jgi:hypothetical protein